MRSVPQGCSYNCATDWELNDAGAPVCSRLYAHMHLYSSTILYHKTQNVLLEFDAFCSRQSAGRVPQFIAWPPRCPPYYVLANTQLALQSAARVCSKNHFNLFCPASGRPKI